MKLQTYKYQAFIREYMRQSSPYRGVLVYHGLGSGKTCTSIAASEALYGQSDKKIIIMTPISLQENFLNELMFCGFRHYRLKNIWVSFPLDSEVYRQFANQVVGISESHIISISRRSPEKRVFWMPDLSKPDDESNYDELEDWERTAIRDQIYSILKNKFEFIGYTGFTKKRLMNIAKENPTYFDDSVIIIDEIHNLTRLMSGGGKLDKFLEHYVGKKGQINKNYEPVTVDTWKPKYETTMYSRAYLFYRLLVQAKNTKIIALSGTPLVNQPVEIGILGNLLHGYFHCAEDTFQGIDSAKLDQINEVLENHPRVNFYSVSKNSTLFFTILDEGYIKVFNQTTSKLEGIKYVGVEEALPSTIQELYLQIDNELKKRNITLSKTVKYSALPLFPPLVEDFNSVFLNKKDLKLENSITFVKRFSGLISYYKGSKEELMPKVIEHPIIECPFSKVGLASYIPSRLREIELEKTQKKSSSWDQVEALLETESSSFRFRTRAACNFAFPVDIERPYPKSNKEMLADIEDEETLLGDTPVDITVDSAIVEDKDIIESSNDDSIDAKSVSKKGQNYFEDIQTLATPSQIKTIKPYKERLTAALDALNKRKSILFGMDSSKPSDQQLKTYSSKYAAILERIGSSKGSSLVYSQFKTVEGIGIFSMALDANGYTPIKLVGTDNDLRFDEETLKSIQETPEKPRYILYSGGESIRMRQTLINLFNMRVDKLPGNIATVINDSPLKETKNLYGQVCRVFMITSAGAEGLSLKNVRAVHIMEPYWNKIRTDQVKGRAVRICSHSDLPYDEDPEKNERVVDIYTYISVLPKDIAIDQTIVINDLSKSTDEAILHLAEIKEKVSADFLCHLKAAAVDCQLNKHDNEETIECFIEQKGDVSDFLYDPRLRNDIASSEQKYDKDAITFCKTPETKDINPTTTAKTKRIVELKVHPSTKVTYHVTKDPSGKTVWYETTDILYQNPVYEEGINPKTGKIGIKAYKKTV